MKRTILAAALLAFAATAFAQGNSGKTPAAPAQPGGCVITGNSLITDMRDSACFPTLDEAKCGYYAQVPAAKTVGASDADVADAKKEGQKVMKFAATQACEGKNCGFYVLTFASTAACDGKVVQDMPGGEYRGLTAAAAINVQKKANAAAEALSSSGKGRGDKTKNPKAKGKIWGAED